MDSVIVGDASLQNKLGALVGTSKSFQLLCRGSRDGFSIDAIGPKIYGKGTTFIIVKSDTQKIFGGYTPIHWQREGGYQKKDGTSFLFSIRDDNTITKLEHVEGKDETYVDSSDILSFANELDIYDNCNQNSYSHSYDIGWYKRPSHLDIKSNEAKYYLNHGIRNFLVVDLEVFLIS